MEVLLVYLTITGVKKLFVILRTAIVKTDKKNARGLGRERRPHALVRCSFATFLCICTSSTT